MLALQSLCYHNLTVSVTLYYTLANFDPYTYTSHILVMSYINTGAYLEGSHIHYLTYTFIIGVPDETFMTYTIIAGRMSD